MRKRTAVLVAALALPTALSAQTHPGGPDLDEGRLTPGVWAVEMVMKRDGQEMVGGTTRYELSRTATGGWMLVSRTTSQLGTAADTSVVEGGTLRPRTHRSHAVPRDLFLTFDGTRVTGSYESRDSAARPIDRTTEVPTFDAAWLEVLLGALPLAPDYATRLPLFIEERGGLAWADVAVVGEGVRGEVPVWEVGVSLAGYDVTYYLGRGDRLPRGGQVRYPNGTVVEMRRTDTGMR